MIGPASTSGRTQCTVHPWRVAPSRSARACVSSPGYAGSSDGWMLISRPRQRPTKAGPRIRMKPARHTSSTPRRASAASSRASNAARRSPAAGATTATGTPAAAARLRAGADGWSDTTTATRKPARQAARSSSTCRLEPRPETSTATFKPATRPPGSRLPRRAPGPRSPYPPARRAPLGRQGLAESARPLRRPRSGASPRRS